MKTRQFILGALSLWVFGACHGSNIGSAPAGMIDYGNQSVALFAGGCFWCMEPPFESRVGVYEAVSGYTGGAASDATYPRVSSGRTGHREAVRVQYDSNLVSYRDLLELFWRSIDPTDGGGQFADRGSQYQPVIYYGTDEEKRIAEESKAALASSGVFSKPIVVPILPAGEFYPAEEYHQDYYQKNAVHYNTYRKGSGREGFLIKAWGMDISHPHKYEVPADGILRKSLTDIQYRVTRENATERPFDNTFWNNDSAGIYVDIISGEPLFASVHKFKSGTGWPSFTQPLIAANVAELPDESLGLVRTEVRSFHGDSHLGHVFNDGPEPTGLRYCINSASLRFIPREELGEKGYDYLRVVFEGR